jgi:hypothetical protein
MRTIQKISVSAFEKDNGDRMLRLYELRLPKDSKILFAKQDGSYMSFWFEGTNEEKVEFETHKLGAYQPEDPLPVTAIRFHSVMDTYREMMCLYEFVNP